MKSPPENDPEVHKGLVRRLSGDFARSPAEFTERLVTIIEESTLQNANPHDATGLSLDCVTREFKKLCKYIKEDAKIEDETMPEWPSSFDSPMLDFSPAKANNPPAAVDLDATSTPLNCLKNINTFKKTPVNLFKKTQLQQSPVWANNAKEPRRRSMNALESSMDSFLIRESECKDPSDSPKKNTSQRSFSLPPVSPSTNMRDILKKCEAQMAILNEEVSSAEKLREKTREATPGSGGLLSHRLFERAVAETPSANLFNENLIDLRSGATPSVRREEKLESLAVDENDGKIAETPFRRQQKKMDSLRVNLMDMSFFEAPREKCEPLKATSANFYDNLCDDDKSKSDDVWDNITSSTESLEIVYDSRIESFENSEASKKSELFNDSLLAELEAKRKRCIDTARKIEEIENTRRRDKESIQLLRTLSACSNYIDCLNKNKNLLNPKLLQTTKQQQQRTPLSSPRPSPLIKSQTPREKVALKKSNSCRTTPRRELQNPMDIYKPTNNYKPKEYFLTPRQINPMKSPSVSSPMYASSIINREAIVSPVAMYIRGVNPTLVKNAKVKTNNQLLTPDMRKKQATSRPSSDCLRFRVTPKQQSSKENVSCIHYLCCTYQLRFLNFLK